MQRSVFMPTGYVVKNNCSVDFPLTLDLHELATRSIPTLWKDESRPVIPFTAELNTPFISKSDVDTSPKTLNDNWDPRPTVDVDKFPTKSLKNNSVKSNTNTNKSLVQKNANTNTSLVQKNANINKSLVQKNANTNKTHVQSTNNNDTSKTNSTQSKSPEKIEISNNQVQEDEPPSLSLVDSPKLQDISHVLSRKSYRLHYTLSSAILHFGSHDSGHFITIKKVGDMWYRISDESVEKFNPSLLQNMASHVYMLFYESE